MTARDDAAAALGQAQRRLDNLDAFPEDDVFPRGTALRVYRTNNVGGKISTLIWKRGDRDVWKKANASHDVSYEELKRDLANADYAITKITMADHWTEIDRYYNPDATPEKTTEDKTAVELLTKNPDAYILTNTVDGTVFEIRDGKWVRFRRG